MATYADLKQRIAREMSRDDLLDDLLPTLEQHIYEACEEYASTRFWFNQSVVSVDTVADVNTVATAMRVVDRVAGPYVNLTPLMMDDMVHDGALGTQTGIPASFAYYDGGLTLYPTPDDAYGLTIYGVKQIEPPTDDADSNEWTNEAQGLISAHTRMTLYRDQFRDTEGAVMASAAVQEQKNRLRRETDRKLRRRPYAQLVDAGGQSVRRSWLDRF